ncbi:MAG TPA: alpha/beta fold hydrolase, partial [Candidatus Saccharimonadia bacterium]
MIKGLTKLQKLSFVISGLVISGLAFILILYIFKPPSNSAKKPAASPQAAQKATPDDPLTIAAIRSRQYAASEITTLQTLGSRENYSDAIVSYRSDGLAIRALVSTPNAPKPAAGWPVVILDHGYINPTEYQTNSSDYREFIAAFTRAGYMVVKPDYRGHGLSEGSPEGGHYSPAYAYDNLNLVASLQQFNQVDKSRIGLFGHSLGGHIALRTIVVSPDVKATVIMSGVVGSIDDLFYNWTRSPNARPPTGLIRSARAALVEKYGEPRANPDFWNNVSAINYVDAVTGPVQIQHSEGDSVVPKLFADHLN